MKNKTSWAVITALYAFFTLFFSFQISAQTINAEKNGSIDYKNDELNRPRVIGSAVSKNKKVFAFSAAQIHAFEKEAFQLINKKRNELSLPELNWSDEVADMARLHSESMAKNNFFSHSGLDGKQVDGRADLAGIKRWSAIGENIAYNRGYENPIEIAVEKWLLSRAHRENLLNSRWRETGIGIAVTEDGTFYFTQVFLQRS